MKKRYSFPLIGIVISLIAVFAWHILANWKAEQAYQDQKVGQSAEVSRLAEVEDSEGRTQVFNLVTGEFVKETIYLQDDIGIWKIAPSHLSRISGSFAWRFFHCGVTTGDTSTWFARTFWEMNSTTLDGTPTSFLRRIHFDPTNPTPFYVILLVCSALYFAGRRLEVKERRVGEGGKA